MNVLDLFSGIGGFSLGLERAGMRTVAFCEIDPYCRAVLKKHWPHVLCYEDIRTLTANQIFQNSHGELPDVICGGFPCQDISLAGKGAGIEGGRSGLWKEYARIIGEVRPRYVIVENVSALLGRGLGVVLGDLAALGYDAEWHCIPASAVGAPHRRDRLWIIANAIGGDIRKQSISELGRGSQAFATDDGEQEPMADAAGNGWSEGQPQSDAGSNSARAERARQPGGTCPAVADADSAGRQQQRWGISIREELIAAECGDWWLTEPNVGRVANGVSFELDLIREIENGNCNCQETEPEAQVIIRRLLRAMWECAPLAETSSDLYRKRLYDLVPELPQGNPRSFWVLGPWIKKDKELRDLWEQLYSAPFHEAQDLQQRVLERIGQKKRPEALGSRVNRLRALGNAVVPQIPEIIGRAIMESEKCRC